MQRVDVDDSAAAADVVDVDVDDSAAGDNDGALDGQLFTKLILTPTMRDWATVPPAQRGGVGVRVTVDRSDCPAPFDVPLHQSQLRAAR
jgi:hypothetical protein